MEFKEFDKIVAEIQRKTTHKKPLKNYTKQQIIDMLQEILYFDVQYANEDDVDEDGHPLDNATGIGLFQSSCERYFDMLCDIKGISKQERRNY